MSKGKSFEYIGAMDSVQITLPNCGTSTADKGTSFEVCAADGKILADNPDFKSASAVTKSKSESEEVQE